MTETETAPEPAPLPLRYATFNSRMIASVLDMGALFMVILPIVDTIVAHIFPVVDAGRIVQVLGEPELQNNPPRFLAAFWGLVVEQHLLERMVVENGLLVFFIALYVLPFWFYFSSTPGKMLFRMEIRDEKTGLPMTRKQAVTRYLGYIVSTVPLSLGFVWMLFNRKCRGFHDLIAGTVVVVKPRSRG